jgi:hypothetical protein
VWGGHSCPPSVGPGTGHGATFGRARAKVEWNSSLTGQQESGNAQQADCVPQVNCSTQIKTGAGAGHRPPESASSRQRHQLLHRRGRAALQGRVSTQSMIRGFSPTRNPGVGRTLLSAFWRHKPNCQTVIPRESPPVRASGDRAWSNFRPCARAKVDWSSSLTGQQESGNAQQADSVPQVDCSTQVKTGARMGGSPAHPADSCMSKAAGLDGRRLCPTEHFPSDYPKGLNRMN